MILYTFIFLLNHEFIFLLGSLILYTIIFLNIRKKDILTHGKFCFSEFGIYIVYEFYSLGQSCFCFIYFFKLGGDHVSEMAHLPDWLDLEKRKTRSSQPCMFSTNSQSNTVSINFSTMLHQRRHGRGGGTEGATHLGLLGVQMANFQDVGGPEPCAVGDQQRRSRG